MFPLFECGLHIENFFQRVQYGKEGRENSLTVEKPDEHYSSQVVKININSLK